MTGSRLLRAADAAQYRAKRAESAVPVVAGHRGVVPEAGAEEEPDRRAFRGRGSRSPSTLVDVVLRRLDDAADATAAERLAIVAQAVAETVDAAGWFISSVRQGTICTVDSAVARAVPDEFPVDDYPASYAAASGQAVFVSVDDPRSDPAEVALLAAGSLSEMLMTGGRDASGDGWLLEVTGDELSSSVRPYAGVARALAAVALRR
jgi:hypothetical protein